MTRWRDISKPCHVVPNHMLAQYTAEFVRLYPNAAVLMAAKEDLEGDRRRELVSRIATGDWDAVVITHSSFERIKMSLLGEHWIAEVLRPDGEPGDVARHERVAQFGQRLGQQALDLIERLAGRDTALVDFAGSGLFGCGAGEDLDTRSNLPCSRDAGW